MAQAKTDNSIPAHSVSTRRRFLSQAAGAAAGGAVLTLATVSGSQAAASPVTAEIDPIFALIDDYRAAVKEVEAAATEVSRREEFIIQEGLSPYPVVCVVDRTLLKPVPVMAYSHAHIDKLVPPDRFSKANAEARAALDVQTKRLKDIVDDAEAALNAAFDAEVEARDTLVWTPPTTVAGVLALLELWPEMRSALDDDQADAIRISVIDALQAIHPNVSVIG
ncbi:hypothetical protein [Bradyrhizobium sp. AUGA SZCCT0160]|uniref:hypothetical protein n=1 Tax=Bradyrhizobium sp. AUGA SZCCT0160 TaxID=2807662 RepID=UPI001BADFE2D|nr:hypothetical protein [Bradyrhizobium sp. AUGA SZCCT0160]MBR1190068.1 hypothetical protein [Bradyrhizobium sp. AUGA SZCCT0160]